MPRPGRAGPDQAGARQRGEQRVGGEGADGTGAVDHAADHELLAVGEGRPRRRRRPRARRRACRCGAPAGRRRRSRASRPAVIGGIRWRWMSQVRASSVRKRRLSSSRSPCQSWAVTERSPSMAARQSPVSSTVCATCASTAWRSSASVPMRVMPGRRRDRRRRRERCTCGTRSWRETACTCGRDGRPRWRRRPWSGRCRPAAGRPRAAPGSTGRRPAGAECRARRAPSRCRAGRRSRVRRPAPRSTAPTQRRTTNRSPRRSMPSTDSWRRSRRALPGYSAAVCSRPAM